MFAHGTPAASGWNIFDFVIVLISTISLIYPQMPGIVVLRLFRAFRVFRLFKRIPSLRKIVVGVMVSLPGVGNAFVILGLIMAIWSIIGVEFFREDMDEEFGNFAKGMLTMFQVCLCCVSHAHHWSVREGDCRRQHAKASVRSNFPPQPARGPSGPIFPVSNSTVLEVFSHEYLSLLKKFLPPKMQNERYFQRFEPGTSAVPVMHHTDQSDSSGCTYRPFQW